LLPLKYDENQVIPSGLVFIGLGTHQTTGVGMHVFSHLIPTVERENLDMQNTHITLWNREILAAMGQVIRFIYDQLMLSGDSLDHTLAANLSIFSFQPSVPNNKIGMLITEVYSLVHIHP
jgi:hypothetical protein